MPYNNVNSQKDPAKRSEQSDFVTLSNEDERKSAYTDAELTRIEQTLGDRARRRAAHIFDLEQMHLSEFTTDSHAQPQQTATSEEVTA
ncbi:hypothetical protein C2R22_24625 (plasmid) [Salinigranum rubrum]|uniref:Uncharacterized protein n=1 Tax=Salinigranum rubrum TaxID=755307 RepID=A0A2I8VS35_9EURY|nr:hypothetical protein [Salinigranum rubrum]AUV84717.1 hypothetical protein C2R22_24625 [Salinigranum rubrum]